MGLMCLLAFQAVCLADDAKDVFSSFDIDGSDEVSFNEFYIVMLSENGKELYDEFLNGDDDKNGLLTFSEVGEFDVTREEYQQADKDNNGKVDLHEFISAMLHDMFNEADLNHDNVMVFSEFKKVAD